MVRRPRLPKSVQELADWYMRYVSPTSLVAGVIMDNLFLAKRVDIFLTNALLFTYLIVAALAIFVINMIQTGHWRSPLLLKLFPLLPVVAQFSFGGLFSAYFSLYSRSAAIYTTWLFVAILVVLIIGNERFAHFYGRFIVQASIYFTVLFSFLIFFLPVVFHTIGTMMFIISGVAAIAVIAILLNILYFFIPELKDKRATVGRSVAVIYIVFNVMYFSGVIPPLPLALKYAGVYHSVSHEASGIYALTAEPVPWYDVLERYNTTYHAVAGESAYVFTSVFAPSGLTVTLQHQWQHYDETTKTWKTIGTISYPIYGGLDSGYRGYSTISDIAPGKWRVNVLTSYGALVGQVDFTVVRVSKEPALQQITD